MESEEIRALLGSIPPPADLAIPVPPNMRAIPTAAVVEAGGDPVLVEKWVRAVKGWPKRIPPLFAPPDATELDLMFFIVPERELEGARTPAASLAESDLIAFVPTKDMSKARPFDTVGGQRHPPRRHGGPQAEGQALLRRARKGAAALRRCLKTHAESLSA